MLHVMTVAKANVVKAEIVVNLTVVSPPLFPPSSACSKAKGKPKAPQVEKENARRGGSETAQATAKDEARRQRRGKGGR